MKRHFRQRERKKTPKAPVGRLSSVEVKRLTGFADERALGAIDAIEQFRYRVDERSVTGAAPKNFVYVAHHAKGVRIADPATWPAYIAKVGHQYYPAESITEQLITDFGKCLGVRVAESRLMRVANQVRFLSRYFLADGQQLTHGDEILAGYLVDPHFVEKVAEERREWEVVTFADLCAALRTRYSSAHQHIIDGLVTMIGFDALVGNNDRHLQNWGVIESPTGAFRPFFSPIYDTARGLYWNQSEDQLVTAETSARLERYISGAKALIGWGNVGRKLDHFELVRCVANSDARFRNLFRTLAHDQKFERFEAIARDGYAGLLSPRRLDLILRCLRERFERFKQAVSSEETC